MKDAENTVWVGGVMGNISLLRKIIIGCGLPIILTVIVSMIAMLGLKHVEQSSHFIKEKMVKAENLEKERSEVVALLESSEKRAQAFQQQIIIVTVIAVLLGIITSFFIARSLQAQWESQDQ